MKYFLVTDTETSHLNPKKGQVMQLTSILKDENNNTIESFNEYLEISGDSVVDLGALRVNKLYTSTAYKTTCKARSVVWADYVKWLLNLHEKYKNIIVMGWNISFDMNYIKEELGRFNLEGFDSVFGYKQLDVYPICEFLNDIGKIKMDKMNLNEAKKVLDIQVQGEMHNSLTDCEVTALVYFKLKELYKEVPNA